MALPLATTTLVKCPALQDDKQLNPQEPPGTAALKMAGVWSLQGSGCREKGLLRRVTLLEEARCDVINQTVPRLPRDQAWAWGSCDSNKMASDLSPSAPAHPASPAPGSGAAIVSLEVVAWQGPDLQAA